MVDHVIENDPFYESLFVRDALFVIFMTRGMQPLL